MRVARTKGSIWRYNRGTAEFTHLGYKPCGKDEPFALVYWSNLDLAFNIWSNLDPDSDGLFIQTVQKAAFMARRYYYKMRTHMQHKNMPIFAKRATRILIAVRELEVHLNHA